MKKEEVNINGGQLNKVNKSRVNQFYILDTSISCQLLKMCKSFLKKRGYLVLTDRYLCMEYMMIYLSGKILTLLTLKKS